MCIWETTVLSEPHAISTPPFTLCWNYICRQSCRIIYSLYMRTCISYMYNFCTYYILLTFKNMHAYTFTCMHTCIHRLHANITYMHSYIHTHTYIHTYTHMHNIHTFIIRAYMHVHAYTHMHTNICIYIVRTHAGTCMISDYIIYMYQQTVTGFTNLKLVSF